VLMPPIGDVGIKFSPFQGFFLSKSFFPQKYSIFF